MSSSSLPLKFAFFFSLSLAGAASIATTSAAPFQFRRKPRTVSSYSLSTATKPKATFSDLLSLLGPPQQAESVNSQVARDLLSCFKFLVPFHHTPTARRTQREIDELIWSPPKSVLELARLAIDSGADPGAIHRALDPIVIPVPDVEGSNEDRCELTRTPYGMQFIDNGLNSYLEFLFETIVERGPSVGLNVSLSRYDFFHGHLFLAKDSGRLGILHFFHTVRDVKLMYICILIRLEKFNLVSFNRPILMAPKFGMDDGSFGNFDATLVLATMLVSQLNVGNLSEPPMAATDEAQAQHGTKGNTSEHPSDHTRIWSELTGSATKDGNGADRQVPEKRNQNNNEPSTVQRISVMNISKDVNAYGTRDCRDSCGPMETDNPGQPQGADANAQALSQRHPSNWVDADEDDDEEDETDLCVQSTPPY